MELNFLCAQCGTSFINKSSLVRHVRTAKYCTDLSIQVHECIYCSYKTKLGHNLSLHLQVCKLKEKIKPYEDRAKELEELLEEMELQKLEFKEMIETKDKELDELKKLEKSMIEMIKEKDKKIAQLELKIAETGGQIKVYRERPGVTNNNNYVNNKLLHVKCDTIRPFTIQTVQEDIVAGKYTFEKFIQGEKGLVGFIHDIIESSDQRNYVCTDSSRHKFHRLLESRDWKEDNGATFLNLVLDELKELATVYLKKVMDMACDEKGDREISDILVEKTKPMAIGIMHPGSKHRDTTFTKIRNELKKLAAV